jgi:hypothetical protein
MADEIILQYVGFTSGALVREYSFVVRDQAGQSREYTVSIANEAFVSHRTRYQDGPDICSLRLRRELAAQATDSSITQFCITDSDLAEYTKSSPKPVRHLQKREQD